MCEWISVKERMPETVTGITGTKYSDAVVVLTEDRTAEAAVWNGKKWIGAFDYWETDENTVTHWMPLPKIPPEYIKKEK